jgi:soluble lytic murein transglycosylase-like protein
MEAARPGEREVMRSLAFLLAFIPLAALAQPVAARDVLDHLLSIRALVSEVAREQRVPDAVAHALVKRESRCYARALGAAGEIGLAQIKLATARGLGFRGSREALFEPRTNLTYGLRYARMALDRGGIHLYQRGIGR